MAVTGNQSDDDVANIAIGGFFFTAVIGIGCLLLFQVIASYSTTLADWKTVLHLAHSKPGIGVVVIKALGHAYAIAEDPNPALDWNFFVFLGCTIGSVGFCEETVKLLPVAYVIYRYRNIAP